MKYNYLKTLLAIILLFLFTLGCGSNINYKPKGGNNSGTVIGGKGNEVEINYYETITKEQKADSILLARTESFADSMLRSIKRLESKLSILNTKQPTKKEEREIKSELKEKKAQRDSAISKTNKYRERMRLRAIAREEYLKEKKKRDSIAGELESKTKDSLQKEIANAEENISPVKEQIQKPKKVLIENYNFNNTLSTPALNYSIEKLKDSIEMIDQQMRPLNQRASVLNNSLRYAIQTNNTISQNYIKRDLEPIRKQTGILWRERDELSIEKQYKTYLLERKRLPKFNKDAIKTKVFPKTGKEFLQSLVSNTTIILTESEYDISPSEVGRVANSNISYLDGGVYQILNIHNIEIIGKKEEPAHIFSNILNAPVLAIGNSSAIKMENLKLGHDGYLKTADVGCGPDGDVISFNNTYFVDMQRLELYGCGTQGLDMYSAGDIYLRKSKIYDCTNGAVSAGNSFNLIFEECSIIDNRLDWRSLFDISSSKNIYINESIISNNKISADSQSSDLSVFSNRNSRSNIFVENTDIENNYVDYLALKQEYIQGRKISLGLSNDYRVGTFKN